MAAQEAADYLKEQVNDRFPDMDEWLVEWREVRGVRGIRVLWAWGPSWLPVRAFCDNFAAVRLEGLYMPVEAPGAELVADYIYVVKQDKGAPEVPWADWGFSEGPYFEEWEKRLGPPSDAQYGRARMARAR